MSNAKLAAFAAALILGVSSSASAQSSQLAVKAPPGMTKPGLVAWCKGHPNARADCREVRADTREIRADRKEVRADRRELKQDIKAGDKITSECEDTTDGFKAKTITVTSPAFAFSFI